MISPHTKKKIEQVQKYHIKVIADKFKVELSTDEINDIYDTLFHEENGIVYHLTSSKIQELSFAKLNDKNNDQESEYEI